MAAQQQQAQQQGNGGNPLSLHGIPSHARASGFSSLFHRGAAP
ncbi:MAG TPA: hypothetical protein VMD06_10520 [Steroidobacteraceae bacterium]|nr:hypothetical protein [Steroidobacteraceae bacterium]